MANWHSAQHNVYEGYNVAVTPPAPPPQRQECDYCGAPGQLETCAYCSTPRGWRKPARRKPRADGLVLHRITKTDHITSKFGNVPLLRITFIVEGQGQERVIALPERSQRKRFAGVDLAPGGAFWAKPSYRQVERGDGLRVSYYDVTDVSPA